MGKSPSYAYSEDESLDPERLEAAYQEVAKNPRLDASEAEALLKSFSYKHGHRYAFDRVDLDRFQPQEF